MYYTKDNTWARERKNLQIGRSDTLTPVPRDIYGTGSYSFTYNAAGDTIQEMAGSGVIVKTFAYDEMGRMNSFGDNSNNATYANCPACSAVNQRVSTNANNVYTRYFFDGNDVVADFASDATLQRRYLHLGLDETAYMEIESGDNQGTYYFFHDGLGSVTDILDSSGNRVNAYDYYAYGEDYGTPSEGIQNRYKFTNREHDTWSSNYYNRARYYNYSNGRFGQRDSMGMGWYYYPTPTLATDPTGMFAVDIAYPVANNLPVFAADSCPSCAGLANFTVNVGAGYAENIISTIAQSYFEAPPLESIRVNDASQVFLDRITVDSVENPKPEEILLCSNNIDLREFCPKKIGMGTCDSTCGPDVTDYFIQDLRELKSIGEKIKADSWGHWAGEETYRCNKMYSLALNELGYKFYGLWYRTSNCPSGRCINPNPLVLGDEPVTICGKCFECAQMGNIAFGFLGKAMGLSRLKLRLDAFVAGSGPDTIEDTAAIDFGYHDLSWPSALCSVLQGNPKLSDMQYISGSTGIFTTAACSPCEEKLPTSRWIPVNKRVQDTRFENAMKISRVQLAASNYHSFNSLLTEAQWEKVFNALQPK